MTQLEQEHPNIAKGAQAAGALWGTAPLMMAAPAAMGLEGTLAARTLAGSGSSGLLQGADTYARTGDDVDKALHDARIAATIAGIATPAMSIAGGMISPTLQPGARDLLEKASR